MSTPAHPRPALSRALHPVLLTALVAVLFTLLRPGPRASADASPPPLEDPAPVPQLSLHIEAEHVQHLEEKRRAALERGYLISEPDSEVPARLRYAGRDIRARVRLKGDMLDHVRGARRSYRVKLRGREAVRGLRVFSLQRPQTRNFLEDWRFHRIAANEGLLSTRSFFVKLALNGEDMGTYILEEHISPQLLAAARRRDGPAIKLSEASFWPAAVSGDLKDDREFRRAAVEVFQRTAKYPGGPAAAARARGLLEGLRSGELAAREVFDLEMLARFWALTEIFGGQHGRRWHNVRYWLDPLRQRLQPIAFDIMAGARVEGTTDKGWYFDALAQTVFEDAEFLNAWVGALRRYTRPGWLEESLESQRQEARVQLEAFDDAVRRDAESTRERWRAVYFQNRDALRRFLDTPPVIDAWLHARRGGTVELRMVNRSPLPVRVLGASDLQRELRVKGTVVLSPRARGSTPKLAKIEMVPSGKPMPLGPSTVRIREIGTWRERSVPLRAEAPSGTALPQRSALVGAMHWAQAPAMEARPGLVWDADAATLRLENPSARLHQDLEMPPRFDFLLGPGEHLHLEAQSTLRVHGALRVRGEAGAPARITGDGSGRILVLGRGAASSLAHLQLEGVGLLIADGSLDAADVEVIGARTEDAINLVRSEVHAQRVRVRDSLSDAIDLDFCRGRLEAVEIEDSGGDALDFSGSEIVLEHIRIARCHDKALSVGEASRVEGSDIHVTNCGVGAASKDLSELTLRDFEINGSVLGLAAYQKKPEFGPATLRLTDYRFRSVGLATLTDRRSLLQSNGHTGASLRGKKRRWLLDRLRKGMALR